MKNPKRGEVGYIKSYRGSYAIRCQDGSWKEIFQDKNWDIDMGRKYFVDRVLTFKRQLYKYIEDGMKIPKTLLEPIRIPPLKLKDLDEKDSKGFPEFKLSKKDRLKTWVD